MAITEKVVVDMNDDLTGDSIPQGGGRTVRFGFGTPEQFTTYDLELSTANEKELEDFLSRYKAAGRIVKPDTAKTAGRTNSTADSEIRKWARSKGLDVPARGKISDEIRAAYKTRNKAKNAPAGIQPTGG
ncbi:histone-like nucleoid-structuring protein Lsr2 [Nocardia sp. NBC_01388]|uniref:Lsr2 dimerization domain-containing protein n=1 Tax=Nocardia sp. NBC_01388 TaxID=2903596 RepID=UPI002F9170F1